MTKSPWLIGSVDCTDCSFLFVLIALPSNNHVTFCKTPVIQPAKVMPWIDLETSGESFESCSDLRVQSRIERTFGKDKQKSQMLQEEIDT